MVLFIEADNGLPEASLSTGPIMVASPMSCIAREVGIPARLLSSCSSFENARHSGPVSSILSVTTNPQFPQNISPLELSVTIGPFPQRGHLSLNIDISFTNFFTIKLAAFRQLVLIFYAIITIYCFPKQPYEANNMLIKLKSLFHLTKC